MNRIDRITAILIQLQSKKIVRAQEIADRFGISLRTVYRDVKALDEAGVPIIGEPGSGYQIMEGYRLPPVMFTEEEATSFLTAEKLIQTLTDTSTKEAYQAALYKIKSVLRFAEKERLDSLDKNIMVLPNRYFPDRSNSEMHIQKILTAIVEKRVIDMGYSTVNEEKYTNRKIDPIGIYFQNEFWYLIAFCKLRNDFRNFRTDRIGFLRVTEERFTDKHPSLQSFLDAHERQQEMFSIRIRVDNGVMKYFGQQKYYNGFVSQEKFEDYTFMNFVTGSLMGFAKFYLLFAEHAEIISPAELKNTVKDLLSKIEARISVAP